mmetsp:Transcript_8708/g.21008  ORF Transcript_8708/g.21008 Transcript_8708/m.21008 type:complete len:95 (-) Transcript_8708:1802-2086(-)
MVDGFERCSGRVVETKNRSRRLRARVPLSDRVQMHAYMCLTRTELLGSVHIDNHDDRRKTAEVRFDPAMWAEVKEALRSWFDAVCGASAVPAPH